MFITRPIKNFTLDGNKVKINESVIEYDSISEDTREILESLISKGAYGSALLTLNKFYDVKSINESKYTQTDYLEYISECNNLMEDCVVETEAQDFRPLINIGGLEIMENANHIARGKGDKLLIEDFRLKEEYDNGSWMTFQNQVEQILENAKDTMDDDAFKDFCEAVGDMAKNYEFGYNEEIVEECEGTQCSDIAEKKDQEVGKLQKPKKLHHITEAISVPKNHGFKGFRLNESGFYTRGNYILINDNNKIKAVRKEYLN